MSLPSRIHKLEEHAVELPRGCQCGNGDAEIAVNLYKPGETFPAKTERPATTTEVCPKCGKEREVQHIYITVKTGEEGSA